MKALITLLLLFAIYWVGKNIHGEYQAGAKKEQEEARRAKTGMAADGMPALAPEWEASLATARGRGAAGLKAWLDRYGPHLRDPRLADIQLDYAVALARQKPAEAKQIYLAVKRRTPPSSPVYPRVKRLEATFGQ